MEAGVTSIKKQMHHMAQPLLPPSAAAVLRVLFAAVPPPRAIWLFGSRANGRAISTSDTDLLVFADEAFPMYLRSSMAKPVGVDIVVAVDENTVEYPWRGERASLKSWNWEQHSDTEATYRGIKFVPDSEPNEVRFVTDKLDLDMGEFQSFHDKAIRLYPDDV